MRSSRRSPSFTGALLLALVAALLVSLASPVPGSAQNVQERDGWISADLLLGDWVRVESNNPRNNGMRIRVVADAEGVRAILTAMPPTGSTAFRVGQLIWTDFDGWGTLSVRGSDGGYYSASFTITEGAETVRDFASRLEIDIDHNGRGNDQTWERAGASIDGDWALVDSDDPELSSDFTGLQVRVEGDRATVSYVTAVASSRYRTGEEFWQGIDGEPPEDMYDPGSGNLEYRDSATRSWQGDQFELTRNGLLFVGTGDEYQVWARPEEAEELMALDERGEPLMDLPTEPADDPDAAGRDLERPGEERTVETGYVETAAAIDRERRIPLPLTETGDPQLAGESLSGPDSERRLAVPDPVAALEQQPATVVGRVFRDDDRDGTFDEDDSGIAGISLDVVAENSGVRSRLQTNADGRFRLEVVGGVNHRISVDRTTLPFRAELTTFHTELHFTVPPGNASRNADFGFHEIRPAVVRGTVWEDLDEYAQEGFGVRDADEPGIENVKIVAKSSTTQESSSVLTDEEGRYVLEFAGDAATTISADTASLPFFGHPSSEQSDYHVVVPAGRSTPALDFGYKRLRWSLAVAVARVAEVDQDDTQGSGQSTSYECRPVDGIPVYLVDSVSDDTITLVTSDDELVSIESFGPLRHRISVDESALPFEGTLSDHFGANWYSHTWGSKEPHKIGNSDDPEYEIFAEQPGDYGDWIFHFCYE